MSEDDAFETELAERLVEAFGADGGVAGEAASNAAAFREEYAETLTVEAVIAAIEEAPYEGFEDRFDAAIGEFAAENEDCTDSRAYRLSGFGARGADPSIGS
ncbi:hypothetical protein [Natronomonas sp.]|uniref:hypothetical protein n=1 Tax=Natronomonas sp. TaxID=2184060 RepID=UPI00261059F4|nr:hypothetical protein [Natronomonas sp.]